MVLAEKNENLRNNGRRSRGPSPNGHGLAVDSDSDDEVPVDKIRVGRDYQATCPELQPEAQRRPEQLVDRALLVWSPTDAIPDKKLAEYITLAKDKYGYNGEQALGMLFWHKHDLDRAVLDLANFTPFPDEWSVEDRVLFEQAFQFHGKSFHRIRQMLPDKTIASLVKYYYSWKKTRTRTSLMDKQARKLNAPKEDGAEDGEEHGSNEESDADEKRWTFHRGINRKSATSNRTGQSSRESGAQGEGGTCSNCGVYCSIANRSPKGLLCNSCYLHWRRTGGHRPTSGPMGNRRGGSRTARGPPKGMHINHDDLATMASGNAGTLLLKQMEREIDSLQRQVQQNKQHLSSLKRKHADTIDDLRLPEEKMKVNARWTNDELLMAIEGFRKYGKDYKAVAEMLGTKTETLVRSFFVNYRKKYNLDQIIKEWERENGGPSENGESAMDEDDVICLSPSPPAKKPELKNGKPQLLSK